MPFFIFFGITIKNMLKFSYGYESAEKNKIIGVFNNGFSGRYWRGPFGYIFCY